MTSTVQLETGPPVQVSFDTEKSPASGPVTLAPEPVKVIPFGLDSVTVSGILLDPTGIAPKLKVGGVTTNSVTQACRFTTDGFRKPLVEGVIVKAPLSGPDLPPRALVVSDASA